MSCDIIDGVPDASGNPQKQVTLTYTPIGTFNGIDIWLDAPDSALSLSAADGTVPADGTQPAVGPFNPQSITFFAYKANNLQATFNVPAPTVQQLWRFYITGASANTLVPPVEYGLTGASPSIQKLVSPPATSGQGVEYAPNVQNMALAAVPNGWTTNPNVVVDNAGDQSWEVSLSWSWPTTDPAFSTLGGVNMFIQNNTTNIQSYPGDVLVSAAGVYTSVLFTILPGTTSFTVYALPFDVKDNSNTLVPGVTASVTFSVTASLGAPGVEFCQLVSSDGVHNFVTVTPVNGADGTQLLQVDSYWQNIAHTSASYDPRFGAAEVVLDKGDGNGPYWSVNKGAISPIEKNISQPATVQNWAFYLRSLDVNNRANTITPVIQFSGGGGSGAVFTPIITGGVLTSCTQLSGGTAYTSAPTATLVDSTGAAIPGVSRTAVRSGTAIVSITVNTGGSGIVATPVIVISVGSATGQLNLGKTLASSITSQFSVVGGALTISALNANIITTGTLKVGNNGSGFPIELDVYDHLGSLIGWIGDDTANSGFVGGWFKQLRVGGATPSAAPLVADSSGNLSITGATISVSGSPFSITLSPSTGFQVTGNGLTTTITNATYAGAPTGLVVTDGSTWASIIQNSQIGAGITSGPTPLASLIAYQNMSSSQYGGKLYLQTSGINAQFTIDATNLVAGTATAGFGTLPSAPENFLIFSYRGVQYKIPYYNN